jgi:PAS domain S-box-containing protein
LNLAVNNSKDTPFYRLFSRISALTVATFGFVILVGWFEHWIRLVQILPDSVPMQFNTALCFVLSGLGLFALTTRAAKFFIWPALVVASGTFLTLLEYLLERNFGIDEFLFRSYIVSGTYYPGRMSPLTASCFILIGLGLILSNVNAKRPWQLTCAGLLACASATIALMALFGYLLDIEGAYGWGARSPMALHTAIVMLTLSLGLLAWAWERGRREQGDFLRWLPVTCSITLMAMIAFVAVGNLTALRNATASRKHTFQVILAAESFQNYLLDIQRGLRGYVTMGDTNALASFATNVTAEPLQLQQLVELTRDNPSQQRRLKNLNLAVTNLLAYDRNLIAIYDQHGAEAVFKTEATGEGRAVFGRAREIIKRFSLKEQKLLAVRDASEDRQYHNAAKLLIFGSASAALLLVLANYLASREIAHRRKAELALGESLTLKRAILSAANYAIISFDKHGVVRTFNPAAEKMLGYAATEVVGIATPLFWQDIADVVARAQTLSQEFGYSVPPGIEAFFAKSRRDNLDETESMLIRKDGARFPALISITTLANASGTVTGHVAIIGDISERKRRESEREKNISELREALAHVKTLSGLIPICGWCKSVRSDQGFWETVEQYVHNHSHATFSHGICPQCAQKFKDDVQKANGPANASHAADLVDAEI